jgi:hypothetical protein
MSIADELYDILSRMNDGWISFKALQNLLKLEEDELVIILNKFILVDKLVDYTEKIRFRTLKDSLICEEVLYRLRRLN